MPSNSDVDLYPSAHGLRDRSGKPTVSETNEDLQRIAWIAVDPCSKANSPNSQPQKGELNCY